MAELRLRLRELRENRELSQAEKITCSATVHFDE